MKKRLSKVKEVVKKSNKVTLWVYVILRILIIFCLIREFFTGNYENVLLCILSLILFLLPAFLFFFFFLREQSTE